MKKSEQATAKNDITQIVLLKKLLDQIQVGIILLDENYDVSFGNRIADRYLAPISSKTELSPDESCAYFARQLHRYGNVFHEHSMKYDCGGRTFQIGIVPFYFCTESGNIKFYYFLCMTCIGNEIEPEGLLRIAKEYGELSKRELDVLQRMLEGKTDREIAAELDVSIHTIKAHDKRIYQKLQVPGRSVVLNRLVTLLGGETTECNSGSILPSSTTA